MSWEVVEPARWDRETAIILAHGAGQGIQSPFMQYFHSALAEGGLLAVHFNFEYMEAGRKIPDPQPKMQALYRQVVAEVLSKYQPKRVLIGGKSMGAVLLPTSQPTRRKLTGSCFWATRFTHPARRTNFATNTCTPSRSRCCFSAEPEIRSRSVACWNPSSTRSGSEHRWSGSKVGITLSR